LLFAKQQYLSFDQQVVTGNVKKDWNVTLNDAQRPGLAAGWAFKAGQPP